MRSTAPTQLALGLNPRDVRRIVLATDADEGGEKAREKIGGEARMRGIEVAYLDAESYGGEEDAVARAKGVLRIGSGRSRPAPLRGTKLGLRSGSGTRLTTSLSATPSVPTGADARSSGRVSSRFARPVIGGGTRRPWRGSSGNACVMRPRSWAPLRPRVTTLRDPLGRVKPSCATCGV